MFERITFRNSTRPGSLIDIGAVAEALIFYGHVDIVGNGATIKYLLKAIPPLVLLDLLRSKRLTLRFLSDQIGVRTQNRQGTAPLHNLITFSSPQHTIEKEPFDLFYERRSDRLSARRFARSVIEVTHGAFDASAVLASLMDSAKTELIVSALLQATAPEYENEVPLRFRLQKEHAGFTVDTNINFTKANSHYHKIISMDHSSLTPAYLLALIQGAHEELYFAGLLDSEIAVDSLSRAIHPYLISSVLEKRLASQSGINAFASLTLGSSHSIREAVNSGKVSFAEIIKLLNKADEFRDWLQSQPIDADLVKNYYDAVVRETWVEKLPTRGTRWGLFTAGGIALDALGLGGLGTALGVTLSAFDAFVLDKLIGGWKPHHFVEHDLKTVIQK